VLLLGAAAAWLPAAPEGWHGTLHSILPLLLEV
jgi:hypothetical protein